MKSKIDMKLSKKGLGLRLVILLMALFSINLNTFAVDPDEIEELVLDQTYTLEGIFSKHYYYYTADQDGTVKIVGTDQMNCYTDETFTETRSDCWNFDGYVDGGKQVSIYVTAGETYYLCYQLQSATTGTFIATFVGGDTDLELTYCKPEEYSTLDIVESGTISLKFSMDVTFDEAILSSGTQSANMEVSNQNGYYTINVKNIVYQWLVDGDVQPGDEILLTMTDVKSKALGTFYGEDGTLTLTYYAPALPTELVETTMPDVFLPWWKTGDEAGMMTMTFSNDLSTDDTVTTIELRYGSMESEDGLYTEEIPYTVDGKNLIIDFTGKSRTRTEMLPYATSQYSTVTIRVVGVKDYQGNYVYNESSGSLASYTYQIDYKEFDITPSDNATVGNVSTIEIEYLSGIVLSHEVEETAVSVKNIYEIEAATGIDVEEVTQEGDEMPTKLIIHLSKTISDAGIYTFTIPANFFMINYPDYTLYENRITGTFTVNEGGSDDDPTGINSVSLEKVGDGKYYTIDGQSVTTPKKKGIYIVNGKKVVIK